MKIPGLVLLSMALMAIAMPRPLLAQLESFHKGVNLTNWFQANSAGTIQFSKYGKKDFEQIKSLGCDVVRLPINLQYMTNGAPDYTLDPLFYDRLDQVVQWADELGIKLILDNHTFDPNAPTSPDVGDVLHKLWAQMAAHYKGKSPNVLYEILNEPHGIEPALWNDIQGQVIQTIREQDTAHTIVVGAANYNSFDLMDGLPHYDDPHLIYTFHFYEPFLFTHQGASWTDPSMAKLRGMPFPYASDSMPQFPDDLKGTWIESSYDHYDVDGTVAHIQALLDRVAQFKASGNAVVYCGEYGAYIPNSKPVDRVFWYKTVRTGLEKRGIPWTSWDYHGGFGLFKADGNDLFDHDLNVPLLEAMGLDTPPQTPFAMLPDSVGVPVYRDDIAPGIYANANSSGSITYYSPQQPNNGQYCIKWDGASQYDALTFDFVPNRDFSRLVADGFALDLMYRGDIKPGVIDIRFEDTKTSDPSDLPWRMRTTLTGDLAKSDGYWHHVRVPLSAFKEQGAWYNGSWYGPENKFDWTKVDKLLIAVESGDFTTGTVWFDNILINNADTAKVWEKGQVQTVTAIAPQGTGAKGMALYPNPTQGELHIGGDQERPGNVEVLDLQGKRVLKLNGNGRTALDLSGIPAGAYLLQVQGADGRWVVEKVIKY